MASRTTTDPIEILLEMGVDLDNLSEEEDYLSALMEAIATIEFKTKGKGDARSAALREEVIKIRKGKRKPQAKKTKISVDSFKKRSATTASIQKYFEVLKRLHRIAVEFRKSCSSPLRAPPRGEWVCSRVRRRLRQHR